MVHANDHGDANGILPDSVLCLDSTCLLLFPEPLPNRKSLNLLVTGVRDKDRNLMQDTVVPVMRNEAVWGDVVINEIMPDPEPAMNLALGEYIELYNRSGYTVNLEGWKVVVDERTFDQGAFDPAGTIDPAGNIIKPGHYQVLTGIYLPNQGATVALFSKEGKLVHAVRYRIPWDEAGWKKEGGWSLELPDPDMVCNAWQNWQYSTDRSGGTPGRLNSVDREMIDHESPVFLWFGYGPQQSIHLQYSEPVGLTGELSGKVLICPGNVPADSICRELPLSDGVTCYFPVDPGDLAGFRIRIQGIPDCQGNQAGEQLVLAGKTTLPETGSILISEIMYDPLEGNPEYIELVNPGSGFIDLKELTVDIMEEGGQQDRMITLSRDSRILAPGDYVVLTRDIEHLMDAYGLSHSGKWLDMNGLENLPNAGGEIHLADRAGRDVDVAVYGDPMHLDLISDTRGISLERISWDKPGSDPGNWHSAASIEGYATPGKINSQALEGTGSTEVLTLEPRVFSPDNDGTRDMLNIAVSPGKPGHVVCIRITGMTGIPIRILANNHLAGTGVVYTWDGETDNGEMVPEGIYVVHANGYDPVSGQRWIERAPVAVIYP